MKDYTTIPIYSRSTSDLVVLIDNLDLEIVSRYRWNLKSHTPGHRYAVSYDYDTPGHRRRILMHRLILDAPRGIQVDHINGNGLDNRRINLRFATQQENTRNRRKYEMASSRYRGVSYNKATRNWGVRVRINPRTRIHLGFHESEHFAALVYDAAARIFHGSFCQCNFAQEDAEAARVARRWINRAF